MRSLCLSVRRTELQHKGKHVERIPSDDVISHL